MTVICAYARFEDSSGDGVDGLTVTWDIERITRTTGDYVALATAEATNIAIGRRGLYGIRIAGADLTLYDYIFTAITASATPTVHEVAAVQTLWSLDAENVLYEETHTFGDIIRIILAAVGGKSTGGGTFTNRYRNVADSKNRIVATVNANGDRVAISIDGT